MNVSEGTDRAAVAALTQAAGSTLLDVHADADHNRAVLTLAGAGVEDDARRLARVAVERLDIRLHRGAHPRLGVVDVVPFVPLAGSTMADAVAARDRFAAWMGATLAVPCFRYGPDRSLPEVRRGAFTTLTPDAGPPRPHPTAGATAVGARPVLVAYNVWLADPDVAAARRIATSLRGPAVRALAFELAGRAQVSFNLIRPLELGPAEAYDAVRQLAPVRRAELVGLLPAAVLERVSPERWGELDLAAERTIEWRLERRAPPGRAQPAEA